MWTRKPILGETKKPQTEKQKLASDRNYFKFVLSGIPKPLNYDSLTELELEKWTQILNLRDELLEGFDDSSRQMSLNVPEHRCWCSKPAKYQDDEGRWVCKKHLEE